jgi:acetyl esterase/lipase
MKKYISLALLFILSLTGFSQEEIRVTRDVVYGHKAGMALTYDVFQSVDKANGAGIIHLVSGGWSSRYTIPDSMMVKYKSLLDEGDTVFSLRHGSTPQFSILEMVEDAISGAWHIYDNCSGFNVDSTRLGIYGGSSGGQLALMAGLTGEKHPVNAIVAFFAPAELRNVPDMLKVMIPALNLDTAQAATVSPILFATPDDPPTLLIHGTSDFMVAPWQSENMYKALQENHVVSKLILYDGMTHGNSFGAKGDFYEKANAEMIGWFNEHLRNKKQP